MLAVLDRYTLDDLLHHPAELGRMIPLPEAGFRPVA
jgi:Rrf2 family transcriptional regulator, nitric oxide-sensitive transcriptional repressor